MKRLAATIVFALAAAGATLAGSGLAVAPHVDPPGTPWLHDDHVLAAYRFPLFMIRLQDRFTSDQPRFSLEAPLAGGMAALVMALLVFAAPRLPRPTLRQALILVRPAIRGPQWRAALPLAPPKASLLRPS